MARLFGVGIICGIGPFTPNLGLGFVFTLGALVLAYTLIVRRISDTAGSADEHRRVTILALGADIALILSAMLLFSPDAAWTTWAWGGIVVVAAGFRLGAAASLAVAVIFSLSYIGMSFLRDGLFGYSYVAPHRLANGVALYLLTALVTSGIVRELRGLHLNVHEHVREIDDLKRTERDVREARDVARATFETVREPLVTLDASLHVVQANRSFYETFRVTPAATEGTFIYDLGNRQWDIPELRRLLEEILPRDSVVSDFEVEHAFEDLGHRTMCLNASIVRRATAEDPLILLAIEDVTDAKHLEEARTALAEREQALRGAAEAATEAKDRFLAVVSHELRTPLQAMLSWIKLLRSRQLGAAQTERALAVIERNTVLQARLIEDLLDVSRISAGMLELVLAPIAVGPAAEAAADGLHPAADAKGIRFVVAVEDEVGPIQGDAVRLGQMVVNLLSNAIKFTPSGGRIELRVARRGSEVEIIVRDTGAGISPDELSQIIAPFNIGPRTRSQGGLGLGLGITRHLAELHGGALHAASAGPDQGATFTLTLPLTAERPVVDRPPDQGAAPPASPDLAGLRVLVVEDDPDTRDVITMMLEESGALVTTAKTVEAALSALETATPDVLMSDLSMPKRDGYDLIRSVRALDPARGGLVPAIALTAYARSEDRKRVISAGYQRYLSKPIDLEELVAAIASLADRT